MEKITLKNVQGSKSDPLMRDVKIEVNSYADVSDGYHTIEELYDHRITLYIALCKVIWRRYSDDAMKVNAKEVWRSKLHHDGTGYDGWFVLAIGTEPGKQITYHVPLSRWDETEFAETFDKAPVPFDGHTSSDVIERLKLL